MPNANRVERIMKMEKIFDSLLAAENIGENKEHLRALAEYYDSGLWLSDYEADERGELPRDLKRGVLSEDGVYNLLGRIDFEY